jgi:hypothetical protein
MLGELLADEWDRHEAAKVAGLRMARQINANRAANAKIDL